MSKLGIQPSWKQGFARSAAESEYPNLWKGLIGLWVPALGPTGLTLRDVSGWANNGTLTNMLPATAWMAGRLGYCLDYPAANDTVNITPITLSPPLSLSLWVQHVSYNGNWNIIAGDGWNNYIGRKDDGSFRVVAGGNGRLIATDTMTTGWELWTVTYDNANWLFYINGVYKNNAAGIGDTFILEKFGSLLNAYHSFRLAEQFVHNRVLPTSEIQHLYTIPHALTTLRRPVYPAAVVPAGGTTNPFSMGAVNLLHGKLAG